MLNIEDIKERYRRNPEPKEVSEIRQLIINSFNKLEFVEEGHKYFLPKANGEKEELISVSKFVEQFVPEVDWDEVAWNYSVKHDMTVEAVKRMWHENNIRATNNGTSSHLYGENLMNMFLGEEKTFDPIIQPQFEDGFLIPYSPKQEAIQKYYQDLYDVDDVYPIMPETKVYTGMNDKYHFKQNYAGTFDILLAIRVKGEIKVVIHDYKTNGSLISDYNRSNGKMMLPPFDDMIDEALSHYIVQLSCYQLALSQLDLPIVDRQLVWIKDDSTYEKVRLPDITERIKEYLK